MSVKRFYPWGHEMLEGQEGGYVKFEDYAVLEGELAIERAERDQLAADKVRLEAELRLWKKRVDYLVENELQPQ